MSLRLPATTIAAMCSAAVVIVATARTPQQLYSDPGWQLKAVQQYLLRESPTPNSLVSADERDLTRNQASWLSWWAPGTNVLTLPLAAAGLPLATSVRLVAVLLFLLGAIGWSAWTDLLQLPRTAAVAVSAVFPWLHYANNALFQYSAEILVFGVMPWVLVAACRLMKSPTVWQGAGVGLLCGLAYVMKYSTALAVAGVVAWLLVFGNRKTALVTIFAMALPIAWLSYMNRHMSGSINLLSASTGVLPARAFALLAVGAPWLKTADLDALLHYVLTNPSRLLVSNDSFLLLVGVPGTVLLAWTCMREGVWDRPKQLAIVVFGSSVAGLAAIWATTAAVSYETRHVATAGLALLPLSIRAGLVQWQKARPLMRGVLLATFGLYLAGPSLYGVIAVAAKVARTPSTYPAGPSGFYNPLFAAQDGASCREHLLRQFNPAKDVWYLTEPMTALDLPGRAVMTQADFLALDLLPQHVHRTSAALRVFALLPAHFEVNGKGAVIRSSFAGAGRWSREDVPACSYVLWTSTVATTDVF